MLVWCSGLKRVLMCVLGPGFNSCVVHFFSSTNNIIKSLQLLFCIDLYYYFYSNSGYWKFHLESTWKDGIHMESTWKDGINVEMGWNLFERFHMESMWKIPCGMVESTWNPPHSMWKIPCGMVESTWNPPHSMWNIGGRKSPKWVRSQPKHIPCGIRGHGKDLHFWHICASSFSLLTTFNTIFLLGIKIT